MFGLALRLLRQRNLGLSSAEHGLCLLEGLDLVGTTLLAEAPADLRFVAPFALFASLGRSWRLLDDWLVQFEGLAVGVGEVGALGYVGYSHVCHRLTVELLGDVHLDVIVNRRVLVDVLLHASRVERRMGTLAQKGWLR